ncbi:MAG: RHS repeat-associated core domain-containing protein [Bacteroidota bacterium]
MLKLSFYTYSDIYTSTYTETLSGDPNDYPYNGKELDDDFGLGWMDYGARMYDAGIGRWNGVYPLAELYQPYSSYSYVLNRPINAIDPNSNLVIFINGNHFGSGATGCKNTFHVYKKGGNWQGTSDYWGSFDDKVMSHLNDDNAINRDGSHGGNHPDFTNPASSASFRIKDGYEQGLIDAEKIIESIKNKDGDIVETIKVVTHSMGRAFGKGYIKALLDYIENNNIEGVIIEFIADFAPFQPKKQSWSVSDIPLYHFSNEYDNVANNRFWVVPIHR